LLVAHTATRPPAPIHLLPAPSRRPRSAVTPRSPPSSCTLLPRVAANPSAPPPPPHGGAARGKCYGPARACGGRTRGRGWRRCPAVTARGTAQGVRHRASGAGNGGTQGGEEGWVKCTFLPRLLDGQGGSTTANRKPCGGTSSRWIVLSPSRMSPM
jgi:hypothetical protein